MASLNLYNASNKNLYQIFDLLNDFERRRFTSLHLPNVNRPKLKNFMMFFEKENNFN